MNFSCTQRMERNAYGKLELHECAKNSMNSFALCKGTILYSDFILFTLQIVEMISSTSRKKNRAVCTTLTAVTINLKNLHIVCSIFGRFHNFICCLKHTSSLLTDMMVLNKKGNRWKMVLSNLSLPEFQKIKQWTTKMNKTRSN